MKLLFFKAPNCPACDRLLPIVEKSIHEFQAEGWDLHLDIIDVSEADPMLVTEYRVMSCPMVAIEGFPAERYRSVPARVVQLHLDFLTFLRDRMTAHDVPNVDHPISAKEVRDA